MKTTHPTPQQYVEAFPNVRRFLVGDGFTGDCDYCGNDAMLLSVNAALRIGDGPNAILGYWFLCVDCLHNAYCAYLREQPQATRRSP